MAPEGSSSSSSSSSSSDSWSFLSSVASETDFWRFLSGSEDSAQREESHLDCTIPNVLPRPEPGVQSVGCEGPAGRSGFPFPLGFGACDSQLFSLASNTFGRVYLGSAQPAFMHTSRGIRASGTYHF